MSSKLGLEGGWWASRSILAVLVAGLGSLLPHDAHSEDFTFSNGVDVRFDNTLKYSSAIRTGDQDKSFLLPSLQNFDARNWDDGQRAFPTGHFTSQRFDLLTEVDVTYKNIGFSGSAAAWYDAVYNVRNHDGSQATYNGLGPSNEFSQGTRNIEGRYIDWLNSYVHGDFTVGGMPLAVRVGRYALLWGESVFATNSIAYAMAPNDVIKGLSIPGSQLKEIELPVAQASFSLQISPKVTVEGYTQFEWRADRLPGANSFFSITDFLGAGGSRILVSDNPFNAQVPLALVRAKDEGGRTFGQFGASLKYHPNSNLDLGLYVLRFDDKLPQLYFDVPLGKFGIPLAFSPRNFANTVRTGQLGTFTEGYARNIEVYGVSASTSFGPVNYGFEVSARRGQDLKSLDLNAVPGANFNNRPLYAVGDTLHYVANALYVGQTTRFWDGLNAIVELSGSQLLEITQNADKFDQTYRHHSIGLTGTVTPQYFQVRQGLDVGLPVTLGWNFQGNAPWNSTQNDGAFYGGFLSLGVTGVYESVWRAGLQYTRFFGGKGINGITGTSETQFLGRDFASFNIQRTF